MNDEDAFQAALDATPDDHFTRLVFADWLRDRDDPRADGYRALALLRQKALRSRQYGWNKKFNRWNKTPSTSWIWMETVTGTGSGALLKSCWYAKLTSHSFKRRRLAEDDAANAFSLLRADQREQLLKSVRAAA